jgi:hypothetical protein
MTGTSDTAGSKSNHAYSYASNTECTQCHQKGPQLWVGTNPGNAKEYGRCQVCRIGSTPIAEVIERSEPIKLRTRKPNAVERLLSMPGDAVMPDRVEVIDVPRPLLERERREVQRFISEELCRTVIEPKVRIDPTTGLDIPLCMHPRCTNDAIKGVAYCGPHGGRYTPVRQPVAAIKTRSQRMAELCKPGCVPPPRLRDDSGDTPNDTYYDEVPGCDEDFGDR